MEERPQEPLVVGRYALLDEIGAGGMASVLVGRQLGSVGFSRVVAIKRLHPGHARDPEFVEMFLDEARLAARVRHPNVVGTLDVVHEGGELFIVMEHVVGESVGALLRTIRKRGAHVPPHVAASIVAGALHGLHAAHEATAEDGSQLGIVHRDVSPQNILVGADGVARVLDFGIAKANVRLHQTRDGHVKGKLQYMAPEQIATDSVTRASDLYSMGIVLWELCAGRRAIDAETEGALLSRVLEAKIPDLRSVAPWVPEPIGAVAHRALRKNPAERFATAREMAAELERAAPLASTTATAEWIGEAAAEVIERRRAIVRRAEALPLGPDVDTERVLRAARALPRLTNAPAVDRDVQTSRDAVGFDHLGKHTGTHTITNTRVVPPRSMPWGWAIAGAALAVVVGSGAWLFQVRRGALRGEAAIAGSAPLIRLEVSAPPGRAPELPPPSDSNDRPATPAATSAGAVDRRPPVPSLAPEHATALARPTSAPSAPPAAASPCDPPTFRDANGIQRVKRECLGKLK